MGRVAVGVAVATVVCLVALALGAADTFRQWSINREYAELNPMTRSFVQAVLSGDTAWLAAQSLDPGVDRWVEITRHDPSVFEAILSSMTLADGFVEGGETWLTYNIDVVGVCPVPEEDPRWIAFKLRPEADERWVITRAWLPIC